MRREVRGRVAVVTGASSGIGRATALVLAREGASVVLGARRADRLHEIADQIVRSGGAARAVPTDVTRPEEVQRLINEATAAFGRLDILVNNAGLGYLGRMESMPLDSIRHLIDVNLMGTIYGIQAAVPIMRRQRSGHIITVSSVLGKRAAPGSGVYSATKAAQVALSDSLRIELAESGIQVSVICPVTTATEFFAVASSQSSWKHDPRGPVYSAEQVAEIILRCIRRPKPEVLVFPPVRILVVLNALWPGLLDRVLAMYWKRVRPGC